MFPRRRRLPRDAFPAVLHGGRRISSEHFSAVYSEAHEGVAVVVSKKALTKAVPRHALKRRVIGVLRELSLPAALVVYPKGPAQALSPEEMRRELSELLSKIEPTRVQ